MNTKKKNVQVEFLTEYIITNYPEFRKKKKKLFKHSVAKAYRWIKDQDTNKEVSNPVPKYSNSESKRTNISSVNKKNGDDNQNDISIVEDLSNSQIAEAEALQSQKIKRKKRKLDDSSTSISEKKRKFDITFPELTLRDVFGALPIKKKILELLANFIPWISNLKFLPKSILILGPKGAGKSYITKAIAGSSKVPMINVSAKIFLSSELGSNTGFNMVNDLFKEALRQTPCLLCIADLHVLSLNGIGGSSKGPEKRIIEALESNISKLNNEENNDQLLVVGEYRYQPTQSMDCNLRSSFTQELFIPAFDRKDRLHFLKHLTRELSMDVSLEEIAKNTPSFLPGDLISLVKNARTAAFHRNNKKNCDKYVDDVAEYIDKSMENLTNKAELRLIDEDISSALKTIVPVLKQDGFPSVPEISMSDIGGMADLKQQIYDSILLSIEKPELYRDYSKGDVTSGILLWGPPGCGKTLLAKAVANEAGINFLLISGAEVLKMYQGESERTIREAFALAKSAGPCVIYFDEFEGICPTRTAGAESGSKSTIVTTLLSELNGVQSREGVYVMASTNRPDVIDPALLRPGRFDTKLYVGLPDVLGRKAIFMASSSNGTRPEFDAAIDLDDLSGKCMNYSGADCAQLIKLAVRHAVKNFDGENCERKRGILYQADIDDAFGRIQPSVSSQALKKYQKMKEEYTRAT